MKIKNNSKSARVSNLNMKALQKEIIGMGLMLLALFLIGALLCFHPDDQASFGTLAWYDISIKAARGAAAGAGAASAAAGTAKFG